MATNSNRSSRTSMRSKQLGQLLVENGDVSPEQVNEAMKTQDAHGGMIGAILRDMGACDDQAVGAALVKQVQVTEIQCEEVTASGDSLSGVSKEFCIHEKLCPFEALGGTLCVIMGNPLNRKSITDLEHMTRKKVKTFKAPWQKIHDLIERSYNAPAEAENNALELEPLALDLDEPHSDALDDQLIAEPAGEDDPMVLEDDIPDIIMPSSQDSEPAGPTGILEIPEDDDIPAPLPPAPVKPAKPVVHATIKGLDTLDSAEAVIVNMAKRPTPKSSDALKPSPLKPKKEAKVNVDLDKFDLTTPSETISVPARSEQDVLDEIERNNFSANTARQEGEILVALKLIPDSYFYTGASPKNAPRSEELMDIIEALPIAEVLAPNINTYERVKSGAEGAAPATDSGSALPMGIGLLGKNNIALQRAPATPMTAIRLGEGEFQKLTLTSVEDVIGEWDWKFTSPGPVAVEVFED